MFTVIEVRPDVGRVGWLSCRRPYWLVWCGWEEHWSAAFYNFEEACRDAALKEWTYRFTTQGEIPEYQPVYHPVSGERVY